MYVRASFWKQTCLYMRCNDVDHKACLMSFTHFPFGEDLVWRKPLELMLSWMFSNASESFLLTADDASEYWWLGLCVLVQNQSLLCLSTGSGHQSSAHVLISSACSFYAYLLMLLWSELLHTYNIIFRVHIWSLHLSLVLFICYHQNSN